MVFRTEIWERGDNMPFDNTRVYEVPEGTSPWAITATAARTVALDR